MDWLSDDEIDSNLQSLQFYRWGFRVNGSALHSFSTKEEARRAFRQFCKDWKEIKNEVQG